MKKIQFATAAISALTVAIVSSAAHAETPAGHLAQRGHSIISVDRLFGITGDVVSVKTNGVTVTQTEANVSLVWANTATAAGGVGVQNPYTTPRAGYDYTIVNNVTLGGSVGFTRLSGSRSSEGLKQDLPSTTMFAIAPRAGYILPVSKHAFWFRGGFTYFYNSIDTPRGSGSTTTTQNGFALNLEPTFVFVPTEHFAFTGSAVLDIPLAGAVDVGGESHRLTVWNFGATVGVLTYF